MIRNFIILFVLSGSLGFSQENLSDVLKRHNTNSVPYITVQELSMPQTNTIILDARELREYQVSHLNNAFFVGYKTFDLEKVTSQIKNKNQTIVVYCSLGIRSETIAEKLKKAGYSNVYNLYGGIFEWKNENFIVYDMNDEETDNVHAFSKAWGKWLNKGQKIYD